MAIGFVAMNSYAIADTYFVGQLGTLPLAAMGFTFPVAFAMISVGLGVGIATSSVVSRLLGAGNRETVQRIVTHAIILGFVLGLILLAIGLGTLEPMFRALGADERTLPLIGQYMRVYYFGSAFVILPMVGNFAIRATGNALAPSLIMVFAALTNIVLDPLLILGLLGFPRLELAGAAIATVVSNVATVVASMAVLYYRERLILPRYLSLEGLWDSWKRLLHVAIPATITNLLVPVIIAFITALVAGFGPEAVAGFGVASRLESVVWIVIFALQSSLAPFVGQNYGAFLMDRVRHATDLSNKFFLAYGLVVAAVLFLVAQPVASVFGDGRVLQCPRQTQVRNPADLRQAVRGVPAHGVAPVNSVRADRYFCRHRHRSHPVRGGIGGVAAQFPQGTGRRAGRRSWRPCRELAVSATASVSSARKSSAKR